MTLTGECPKLFEDFGVRKKVEKWQFSDKFGSVLCPQKLSLSLCINLIQNTDNNFKTLISAQLPFQIGTLFWNLKSFSVPTAPNTKTDPLP